MKSDYTEINFTDYYQIFPRDKQYFYVSVQKRPL